jgi:hypothetical protein
MARSRPSTCFAREIKIHQKMSATRDPDNLGGDGGDGGAGGGASDAIFSLSGPSGGPFGGGGGGYSGGDAGYGPWVAWRGPRPSPPILAKRRGSGEPVRLRLRQPEQILPAAVALGRIRRYARGLTAMA